MILASLFLPSAAIGLSLIAGGERPERKKGKAAFIGKQGDGGLPINQFERRRGDCSR
jgi:hypothetical protein